MTSQSDVLILRPPSVFYVLTLLMALFLIYLFVYYINFEEFSKPYSYVFLTIYCLIIGAALLGSVLVLMKPDVFCLKVHSEGFEIRNLLLFQRSRFHSWSSVSPFRIEKDSDGAKKAAFTFVTPDARSISYRFPITYGISAQELVDLMNERRRQALNVLATSPRSSPP